MAQSGTLNKILPIPLQESTPHELKSKCLKALRSIVEKLTYSSALIELVQAWLLPSLSEQATGLGTGQGTGQG